LDSVPEELEGLFQVCLRRWRNYKKRHIDLRFCQTVNS